MLYDVSAVVSRILTLGLGRKGNTIQVQLTLQFLLPALTLLAAAIRSETQGERERERERERKEKERDRERGKTTAVVGWRGLGYGGGAWG